MQVLPTPTSKNAIAEHEQVLGIPLGSFTSSMGLLAFFIPSIFKVFEYCITHSMLE